MFCYLNPFVYWKLLQGYFGKQQTLKTKCCISSQPAAFARNKTTVPPLSGKRRNIENSNCGSLKYKMGNPILIVSICIEIYTL